MKPVLKIRNLRVYYRTKRGIVKALDNVSFDVYRGEILGVVGESGCGKSTLGLTIMRLLPPNAKIISGQILFNGVDLLKLSNEEMRKLRGSKISMIFQDPMTSFNPLMKIGDHVLEVFKYHEFNDLEKAKEIAVKILQKMGLESGRFYDYPHQLSGGQRQRVMIATAIAMKPEVIIADEPTTALDVITQAQILKILRELRDEIGSSIILITHNLGVIAQIADRVVVMYAGKVVEVGNVDEIFSDPKHPYTQGLIRAVPKLSPEGGQLQPIPGSVPDLINPPSGCRFHPRCPFASEICSKEEPPAVSLNGRLVYCHLYKR